MATLEPVDFNPFASGGGVPKQPVLEPVDFDPFSTPNPSTNASAGATAPVSNPPVPKPRPGAAPPPVPQQEQVVDVTQPAPGRDPKDMGFDAPFPNDPPVPGAAPGHFSKSFWNTVLEQNPRLVAEAFESFSGLSGVEGTDPLATTFGSFSRDIKQRIPDAGLYKPSGIQFTDVNSLEALNRWFQESAGQALGSSVMSIVPAIGGAAVGGRVGGRTGAAVGTAVGAGMGSFVPAQGEVYEALKKAGVSPKEAASAAVPAAMVIAGLDAVTPAGLVAKLGGREAVKDQAKKFILRRIAEAAASGAKKEGITEGLQEAVKELDVAITADKEFWTPETGLNVLNAAAAGAVGGGALMGPTGLAQNKVSTEATPEQVAQVAEETGTNIPVGEQPIAAAQQPPMGTPLRVEAGPENIQQEVFQPAPNEIGGEIQFSQDKPNIFYSPVKKFVEEKGQNIATAEQWENTLRNAPGVKQEEVIDLGLDSYFKDAKERGEKITKGDLIRELEERAITVEERIIADSAFAERDTHLNEVSRRFAELVERDPTALGENGLYNQDHPEVSQLYQDYQNAFGAGTPERPVYEQYVLPGERQNYTELLLHLPSDPNTPDYIAPHFGAVGSPGQTANQNLLAHARMTERTDRDGVPVAVIEEIQSDWHQAGRKKGYTEENIPLRWGRNADGTFYTHMPDGSSAAIGQAPSGNWIAVAGRFSEGNLPNREAAENFIRQRYNQMQDTVPQAPFKSSWDELTFKRVLRWAADKGYRRLAIVDAAEQSRRYGTLDAQQEQGMREFYDRKMPSLMKKWAKRLGGRITETNIGIDGPPRYELDRTTIPDGSNETIFGVFDNDTGGFIEVGTEEAARAAVMRYNASEPAAKTLVTIEIPESGIERVQSGLPMYSMQPRIEGEHVGVEGKVDVEGTSKETFEAAQQFAPALDSLLNMFKLQGRLKFFLHQKGIVLTDLQGRKHNFNNNFGLLWTKPDGSGYELHIDASLHDSAATIWATVVHELGHAIQHEHFNKASSEIKTSIKAAYDEYISKLGPNNDPAFRKVLALRDNFMSWMRWDARVPPHQKLSSQLDTAYWVSFEEWFAEQTAKWALTTDVPLSIVDKFFHGMAKKLMQFWATALDKFGIPFRPAEAVAKYLDSFHTGREPFARNMYKALDFLTQKDNQAVMGDNELAVPMQPETTAIRDRLNELFEGGWFKWPFNIRQAVAYADKFSLLYKYGLGIHQVAQRNPHIRSLAEYVEMISVAQLTKQQIMSRAHEVVKQWNKLGPKRSDQLAAMIDDVQNMVYRTPQEVTQKVVRNPTPQEVRDLIAKHKLDAETLQVFNLVRSTFAEHLMRYEAILMKEAGKISDPVARQARFESIKLQIAALRNKPYFPAMRFGNYTITVRNKAGQVIHFETFETKSRRGMAARDIQKQLAATDNIQLGYLAEQAQPLLGVPTTLLEMMADKLTLSPKQRDALEQLKFELSPAQSFKHRFQHKRRVAGYSMDFRRAYANYFFHGANHMMKVMYADELRSLAEATRKEVRTFDATKRHQIANYMADHLQNWLDPKSDWQAIRSIAFLWSLAFSPAAAAQNLSQTVMTTYPFLASKFGDHKALPRIMSVMGDLSSFYKRGKLENLTDFDYRALSLGIQEGVITEAMAPELAAIAEGENFKGIGGNAAQQLYYKFNEAGASLFQLAEQFNRRVVFRAALQLARNNPNAKYVREMLDKHKLKFEELRKQGWTETEAAAYVTAVDATQETQFRYGREFAPRFMRGKARSIFVFKTFITSYLVFLGHYPGAAIRSVLLLAFLGGMMAVPGAEDIKEITKALAWKLFGKDFNIEKEVRKLVLEWMGNDEKGRQNADFVLHGAARRGFGIPAFMDMLGGTVGIDIPMPTFDRSRAISAGTLLPAELGKLFGPPIQDQGQVIADQAQKASGAVFGSMINVYKAITNERLDWNDSKRWERAVPRALGSIMRAGRYYTDERERTQDGSTLVSYDPRDTEQLMEILGVAAGYQPLRQSLKWDVVIAQREATKLWDIQREGIMRQYFNALKGKDEGEINRLKDRIKAFNTGLPDEARGKAISADTLRRSVQSRARSQQARENESSVRRSDIPIMRKVQELYPETRAITRPVR